MLERRIRRLLPTANVNADRTEFAYAATEAECRDLASALAIETLESLAVSGSLRRLGDGKSIELSAVMRADVVQACRISLEPVNSHLEEAFRCTFSPETEPSDKSAAEIVVDCDVDDPPDPMVDEQIDLAAVIEEQLALAIDPYPRRPDAELPKEFASDDEIAKVGDHGPFAILQRLKQPN